MCFRQSLLFLMSKLMQFHYQQKIYIINVPSYSTSVNGEIKSTLQKVMIQTLSPEHIPPTTQRSTVHTETYTPTARI